MLKTESLCNHLVKFFDLVAIAAEQSKKRRLRTGRALNTPERHGFYPVFDLP